MVNLIFSDEHSNEMKFYANDQSKLYIEISNDDYPPNFIVLNKSDAKILVKELKRIIDYGRLD